MHSLLLKKANELPRVLKAIEAAIYSPVGNLKVEAWKTPEPVPYHQRESGKKVSLKIGDKWGNVLDCAWFHFTGSVPKEAAGRNIVLIIDLSGEACVFDGNGTPILGLTTAKSLFDYSLGEPGKKIVPISRRAKACEPIDIWADAGCNDLFGVMQNDGTLQTACIAIFHEPLRDLFFDFGVLHDLMGLLPQGSARRWQILSALCRAADMLKTCSEAEALEARKILAPELAKKGGAPSLRISAIGHSHIDLAWLWPIRETIRKGARTFSTALALMEQYPDYIFGQSQPQIYQWMKDYYPALYKKIKKRIAEGRWEVQGAMWVEADTNVSGGEALVRQLLLGKRFFRQEFGKDVKNLWLPDVFGYTGALPQLLRKSGVDYFMTQKMSWSETNVFPHNTFRWKGIDGSTVITHLPPEDTYNSAAAPRSLHKTEYNNKSAATCGNALLLFGIGDGGGGPGVEHLERLAREKNLDGLAPVVQEPAEKFFERIGKNPERYDEWTGELYLERHRGTYTTQARNKRYNRLMELALRDAEFSLSIGHILGSLEYPTEGLDAIWKEVLLYQFHDILPGSSIKRVYDESLPRYKAMHDETLGMTLRADEALAGKIDTSAFAIPVVAINSLSWERNEWVRNGNGWLKAKAPSMGYAVCDASAPVAKSDLKASPKLLENSILRVQFAADGSIVSVYDKQNAMEALHTGSKANRLAVYEDHGDAWDFSAHYRDKVPEYFRLEKFQPVIDGPQAIMKQIYSFGNSRIEQEIILTEGSRRLDFRARASWHETHKMLRTSFPISVSAQSATCDIQFGSIERPTHGNTSWDKAKYEICAQKWIDISRRDYGVALLNDCKYGHKVEENLIDLNLLRSPTHPDAKADQGDHEFTYSLYPHAGDHVTGNVARAGYELNVPLRFINTTSHKGALEATCSYFTVDSANVIIETVKKAEDDGSLIVRLYEASGQKTKANLRFGFPVSKAELVNLMEETQKNLKVKDNAVSLEFGPFEIITVKVY